MPPINYSKTVIYMIGCKDAAVTYNYIWHTTDPKKCKYYYKRDCKLLKEGEPYDAILSNGGWDNWEFRELENFTECKTKLDANFRTLYWREVFQHVSTIVKLCPELAPKSPENAPKCPETPQKQGFFRTKAPKKPQSSINFGADQNIDEKHVCIYCKKTFSKKYGLNRHQQTRCKNIEAVKKAEEEISRIDSEINNNNLKEKMQIYMTTHNKKDLEKMNIENLNKVVSTNNNTNNVQNNINNNITNNSNNTKINNSNNTINNNQITIVELGRENLSDFFTPEQQKQILQKRYGCLDYLVESVHFNDKYKQFQNVVITNMNNGFAYKYSNNAKKFVSVSKDSLLDNIFDYRMADITEFFENCKDDGSLDPISVKSVQKFIDDMDLDNCKRNKITDIKLIMYNNRDKVNRNSKAITNI